MHAMKKPTRELKTMSRNTLLVFLMGVEQYRAWRKANPNKDAAKDFPGFDPEALRDASKPYKKARPLTPNEIIQHAALLARCRLFARRPGHESGDSFHFTLSKKGEDSFYAKLLGKIEGELVLPLILDPANEKVWSALVVMAYLARPAADSRTDDQIALDTGMTYSSVASGRRMALKGFKVWVDGPVARMLKATFIEKRTSGGIRRCLHPDHWVLTREDLTDAVAALAASPVPPKPVQPPKPAPAPVRIVKDDETEPQDRRVVVNPKAVKPIEIVLTMPAEDYDLLREAINNAPVEDYLLGVVKQTAQKARARQAKLKRLQQIKDRKAALMQEELDLQRELGQNGLL